MNSWSHGYNVALGYTYGYYRETAPHWLDFAARLAGVMPPSTHTFRYLELGCGQGFGLTLLAALNPDAEFVGVDFNPVHIAHARTLADAAGLRNIRFEEADFLSLAKEWPDDYGLFDYAVLHGILSWVSEDLRRAITGCLRHCLKPGSLVYASYNTQPGWMAALPLQHLLCTHQKAKGLAPVAAIEQGLTFMEKLKEAHATLFTALPQLSARMTAAAKLDRAYLVQEYLHDNWKCFWFSEIVHELAPAKVEFAGTATLSEPFLHTMLPDAQKSLINDVSDIVLYQELLDACINQSFRRDLFQRGLHRPWPAQRRKELLNVQLMLLKRPKDEAYTFATVLGELAGRPEIYTPLLDALAEGPKSLAELAKLPPFVDQPLVMLMQVTAMLLHGDMAGISVVNPSVEGAIKFNRAVAQAAALGAPYNFIACASIGNGIPAQLTDLLFLGLFDDQEQQTRQLAEGLLQRLKALGKVLGKDGQTLTEPEAIMAEAERLADIFIGETLPHWKRMGAWV